ncbi:hypothetical protein HELRODRAFT_70763, partial [Helobdella robusta]
LKQEREQNGELIRRKRMEVEQLNMDISTMQNKLPADGISELCPQQRANKLSHLFDEYIRERTLTNWKFYIFSLIVKSWLASYNDDVMTSSRQMMHSTIFKWVEQKCSLPILRNDVLTSLCNLSKSTSILTDPSILPQQVLMAVQEQPTD